MEVRIAQVLAAQVDSGQVRPVESCRLHGPAPYSSTAAVCHLGGAGDAGELGLGTCSSSCSGAARPGVFGAACGSEHRGGGQGCGRAALQAASPRAAVARAADHAAPCVRGPAGAHRCTRSRTRRAIPTRAVTPVEHRVDGPSRERSGYVLVRFGNEDHAARDWQGSRGRTANGTPAAPAALVEAAFRFTWLVVAGVVRRRVGAVKLLFARRRWRWRRPCTGQAAATSAKPPERLALR